MAKKPVSPTFPKKPPNLEIGAELSRGAWGVVYNGELEGRPVAVKKIHDLLQYGGKEEERRKLLGGFQEECKKLQALNHPHVVGFIGAFNDPRLGPILVMEKMQENLREFLDKWKKNLKLSKQLRISLEIIRGVAFLHQQTPPLVHRDLNDKNVMFSFEGVVKIGDFGQSKLKKDLYLTTDQPGMVTFMPPEALAVGKSKYNESLDIFSIGVLMLEIGTQQEPLANLHGIGIIREVERRESDLKLLREDHPLRPSVLLCIKDNPKERPKALNLQRDVLAMVDGEVEDSTAVSVGALQERNDQLMVMSSTLQKSLAQALEESEARKQHEQILEQQLNEKLALEKRLEAELGTEKKAKFKLAEMCEQLQVQLNAYEEDFNAERRDRESAHDKFADREREWMDQLRKLTEKCDRLTGDVMTLKDQLVAGKRELEAKRKEVSKESSAVKALKADFATVVANKEEDIQRMSNEIKGLQPIADQYRVLFAEKKELQVQFDAIVNSHHSVQQMFRDLQGGKDAADSRVKELTMVVGQVMAENETLNQQNSQLKQQIESFETMFSEIKSKCEALEAENARLRDAICLPDIQITQKDREDRRSLPAPYIGADVNREISHEARKHRGDKFAVEMHDVDSWPFDPNLTCSFCGRMFRRGQIRDFRYHVDDCTARSMEERK